jgi:hypothetical protein
MKSALIAPLVILNICLVSGCISTVAPRPLQSTAASFDGDQANSGFIGFGPDGAAYITSHARDRYNGLIALYGRRFVPALQPDAGVRPGQTNGTWRIDAEHLADFARMNRWRKEGR